MSLKKISYLLAAIIITIVGTRFFSGNEDTWLCQDGQWVKHGQPDSPEPNETCPVALRELKVFFGNSQDDPNVLNCQATKAVIRSVDYQSSKYEAVMKELLSGPTSLEKEQGYFSSLNTNLIMPNIVFDKGVIRVDFQSDFNTNLGGSCKVTAIRAQITDTLRQFSEVKEVIISVNGNTEDILQP